MTHKPRAPMAEEEIIARARAMGLDALVALDPAQVVEAARKAEGFARAVQVGDAVTAMPWPPMRVGMADA